MAGFCECFNEPSIKYGDFIGKLRNWYLQKDAAPQTVTPSRLWSTNDGNFVQRKQQHTCAFFAFL